MKLLAAAVAIPALVGSLFACAVIAITAQGDQWCVYRILERVFWVKAARMIKLRKVLFLILAVVAFSGGQNANAQVWMPGSIGTPGYDIKSLFAGENFESIAVSFDGAAPNPSGCGYTYSYLILPTNPKRKEVWQLLQLAFATGKKVNVLLNGCAVNGGGTLPVILNVFGSN